MGVRVQGGAAWTLGPVGSEGSMGKNTDGETDAERLQLLGKFQEYHRSPIWLRVSFMGSPQRPFPLGQ